MKLKRVRRNQMRQRRRAMTGEIAAAVEEDMGDGETILCQARDGVI